MRALVGKRVARGRVELSVSLQLRQTPGVDVEFNEEFGRALEAALEQARARGPGRRRADAGRPAAAAAGAHDPRAADRRPTRRCMRELARSARAGAWTRRSPTSTRCASREGDHLRADLDQRRTFVADLVERIAVGRRRGARGDGAAARRAGARAARRAAGRRGRGGAGDRADGGAVGHQRRGRALPRPRRRTGSRSPTAPSRAAGSSISCCRR